MCVGAHTVQGFQTILASTARAAGSPGDGTILGVRPDPFTLLASHIPKQNHLLAALPAAHLEDLLPIWNRFHWNSAGQCTNPAIGRDMCISLSPASPATDCRYAANPSSITQCSPGPSRRVRYPGGPRFRRWRRQGQAGKEPAYADLRRADPHHQQIHAADDSHLFALQEPPASETVIQLDREASSDQVVLR
jgi:hypothetical protein